MSANLGSQSQFRPASHKYSLDEPEVRGHHRLRKGHSFVQFFARTGLCLSVKLQQLKIELDPLLPTLSTKDLIQTRPSWIVNNAAASLAVRVDEHRGQRFVSIPTVPWGKKARIPQAKRQRE